MVFKLKLITLLFLVGISLQLTAQTEGNSAAKPFNFTAAVTVQSKGISTIPNLTLGKPAMIFDLKMGRKLTFEPQFRFALDGKPWAMVFWWRYNQTLGSNFRLTYHTNYSFSYKSITSYSYSGKAQDLIRTTRYLVGALEPNYKINNNFGLGLYLFYNYGIESFITRNTYMASFRPTISNIPVAKNVVVAIAPEVYFLKMDDKSGVYFNSRFSVSKKNCPISISGLINKPLKSNIPSEYDFLWNVGLSYTFNKRYIAAP